MLFCFADAKVLKKPKPQNDFSFFNIIKFQLYQSKRKWITCLYYLYQFYLQNRVPSFDVNTFDTCADFLMRPS